MFDDDVELVEKNYLKKLEEIAEKSKWISVKDRLPDEDENVLTYWANGGVTHWMPLPKPPESEVDEE